MYARRRRCWRLGWCGVRDAEQVVENCCAARRGSGSEASLSQECWPCELEGLSTGAGAVGELGALHEVWLPVVTWTSVMAVPQKSGREVRFYDC